MVIEQFNVQPALSNVLYIFTVALIVFGAILLVTWVLLWNRFKHRPTFGGKMVGVGIGIDSKYGLVILGIVLIVVGGFVYGVTFAAMHPSIVTIGEGYIDVESKEFTFIGSLLGISSNKNVTSDEIAMAFVGQVGSGDFKLNKQHGANLGDTNVGVFTLRTGATAYVATTNSTCLMIQLKSGEYLIVGTSDTQALADSFSQNVHSLSYLDIYYD